MARKTRAAAPVIDDEVHEHAAAAAWPTVWLAPADLTPYPQNPRDNERAIAAVAASIEAFGFRQPIVVDADRVIVVGDTRWRASQRLGLARVPVHIATDLTPDQARAYRIADNKTNELAAWNLELLAGELREMGDAVDWRLFGFQEKDLAQLLDVSLTPGMVDPDNVPEPGDAPVTQRGDLYELGAHRLLCGESGSAEDVDRLLGGEPVDLVHTDPPYNVKVESRSNNAIAQRKAGHHHQTFDLARAPGKAKGTHAKMRPKDRELVNDWLSDEAFASILDGWCKQIARVLRPGGTFYMWGGFTNLGNYPPALVANKLYFSQAVI